MKKKELDFAEQQLLGFFHCQNGYTLSMLLRSMGLTKKEWTMMKEKYGLEFMNDKSREEIEKYFEIHNG